MRSIRSLIIVFAFAMPATVSAAESALPTWEEHVRPILKARCFACHGEETQEAGLALHTFAAALKGSGGGEVLKAGRPKSSILLKAVSHEEGVSAMPPDALKIPDDEIAIIREWILAGLLERSGSGSTMVTSLSYKPAQREERPEKPAIPIGLPPAAPIRGLRNPVVALAASPWAPLIASGGHGLIRFVESDTRQELGAIPFSEGIPQVLRFSQDGAVVLVAGGKPVQSGIAVLHDVGTGKRLSTYGDEIDTVLAADMSADATLVAIGGPSRAVKVFRAADGTPAYKLTAHNDWITAIEFSPDGSGLATGDRAGGLRVWESQAGGVMFSLAEHTDCITTVAWRPDGRILASASEDGSVILWDATSGFPVRTMAGIHTPKSGAKQYGKPPGGVLGLAWAADGRLFTAGRDGFCRIWDEKGKQVAAHELVTIPLRIAICHDGQQVVIGDAQGNLHWWSPHQQPSGSGVP